MSTRAAATSARILGGSGDTDSFAAIGDAGQPILLTWDAQCGRNSTIPGSKALKTWWQMAIGIFVSVSAAGSYAAIAEDAADAIVQTDSGKVRGSLSGQMAVFKGIAFAQPPVGPLRWKEPQPNIPWSGVHDTQQVSNSCVQEPEGLDPFMANIAIKYGVDYARNPPVKTSEDCLYLNVWSPQWSAHGSLPVMVWLHGGSNTKGSGTQSMYDGAALASHGVLVVTINYRLGIFGYFSHPDLVAESPHHSAGNYGLLDQIAALKWVKANIAGFGGDPDNVTVFGESAGSVDATLLMTSPLARGYFRRVIAESGPPYGLGPALKLADTMRLGAAIGHAAPGDPATPLQNLRALRPEAVVSLAAGISAHAAPGERVTDVIVDGWVIPQDPRKAFANNAAGMVDLLIGLNGREMSAFRPAVAPKDKNSGENPGVRAAVAKIADTVRPLYGNWTNPAVALYLGESLVRGEAAIDQAMNDMGAACPIGSMASLLTAAGHRVYVYRFDRTIPGKGEAALGSFHSLELPYVFDAFQDPAWRWLQFSDDDLKLSHTIEDYWTNFAKHGDPNGDGQPVWLSWNGHEPYIDFLNPGIADPHSGFSPPFCHLAPDRLKEVMNAN
jgi:para-nitrobenzyl esterase